MSFSSSVTPDTFNSSSVMSKGLASAHQAPVVSVQPDDVWYGGVDGAGADRIVGEHLVAGEVVEALRLRRLASG